MEGHCAGVRVLDLGSVSWLATGFLGNSLRHPVPLFSIHKMGIMHFLTAPVCWRINALQIMRCSDTVVTGAI